VRVLSSPGRGTTVEIFLPRAMTGAEGEAVQVNPVGWRGTETVLVVDDDRDVRELTVLCLEEFGYRVLEADSGPHGLEVLSHEGSIDLLLVDFLMPAMNGAELVRLARRMRPDLKVIFMTGYADLEAVTQHADPDDIIYKPFKMAALAEQIGGALAVRARV
jgi:CheY-like chemotaxis protein